MLIDPCAGITKELLEDAVGRNRRAQTLQYLLDEVGLKHEGQKVPQLLAFASEKDFLEDACESMAHMPLFRKTDLNSEGIRTALCSAALKRVLRLIERFLEQGVDINRAGASGEAVLPATCSIMGPSALSTVLQLFPYGGADMRGCVIDSLSTFEGGSAENSVWGCVHYISSYHPDTSAPDTNHASSISAPARGSPFSQIDEGAC